MTSLNPQVMREKAWIIIGYGIRPIVCLGGTLILTRLFLPEVLGLMALVYIFVLGLRDFANLNMSRRTIHTSRSNNSTSRRIFTSTALAFFSAHIALLILWDLFSLKLLGVYVIALTLSILPRQVVATRHRVMFPAGSQCLDQHRPTRAKMLAYRRPLLLIFSGWVALMVGGGDLLVQFLYDDRYRAAAWMLPILALGVWPRLLAHTSEPYLVDRHITYGHCVCLAFTAVGIGFGFMTLGTPGTIIGVALSNLSYYLAGNIGSTRAGFNSWGQDFMATALLLGLLILTLWVRFILKMGSPLDALLA